MQITVVALMCHTLAGISQPVCREEIVVKDEMPMQACMLSQPACVLSAKRTVGLSADSVEKVVFGVKKENFKDHCKNALPREIYAQHSNGGDKTHDDWPANMILG